MLWLVAWREGPSPTVDPGVAGRAGFAIREAGGINLGTGGRARGEQANGSQ